MSAIALEEGAARAQLHEPSDEQLVSQVRGNDDHAFATLYLRYERRIGAYIQGMVRDHARAEDVMQEVFISALRRMRETDRPIAFKAWVYEIAKNACIDQYRRSKRGEEVSYDAGAITPHDHLRLVATGPGPDVAVEEKQQLDHLCGAFDGLSESHHEILVLRELEGMSYRDIGERMGMSRAAVESTLFRARRRLSAEYDELVTGRRCASIQQLVAARAGLALGPRERRRIARHLSYCQPCRRHAAAAGLTDLGIEGRSLRARIAALLPLPGFLRSHHGGSVARWTANLGDALEPYDNAIAKLAVAATIAGAGIGIGLATGPQSGLAGAGQHSARFGSTTATGAHVGTPPRPSGRGSLAGAGAQRAAAAAPAAAPAPAGGQHSNPSGNAGGTAAGTGLGFGAVPTTALTALTGGLGQAPLDGASLVGALLSGLPGGIPLINTAGDLIGLLTPGSNPSGAPGPLSPLLHPDATRPSRPHVAATPPTPSRPPSRGPVRRLVTTLLHTGFPAGAHPRPASAAGASTSATPRHASSNAAAAPSVSPVFRVVPFVPVVPLLPHVP